jgi:hypothetical protein
MAVHVLSMDLPVIDLDLFLAGPPNSDAVILECKKVRNLINNSLTKKNLTESCLQAAEALIVYGALVLRDSRVSERDNTTFLDLMEDYFAQPQPDLLKDQRPELSYQVGVTLENTERPKCAVDEPCLKIIEGLEPSERPLDISAHSPDPKSRFFWKMSENPPYKTEFPGLNAPNVVPQADSLKMRWTVTMEQWGKSMKSA